MTVTLPRLNVNVQLVTPSTGVPTRQGAIIWDGLANAIEKNTAQLADVLDGGTEIALRNKPNEWSEAQTFDISPVAPGYVVGSTQVVGAQQPTIAALAGTATLAQVITAYNTLLAALKTHGLIAP